MALRPRPFAVLLTHGAEQDLEALHDYLSERDGVDRANVVLDRLMQVVEALAEWPDRGAHPRDLLALGIREYRQTWFKPYRVIYRVVGSRVGIYLIADGHRNFQTLLARRLLGA